MVNRNLATIFLPFFRESFCTLKPFAPGPISGLPPGSEMYRPMVSQVISYSPTSER